MADLGACALTVALVAVTYPSASDGLLSRPSLWQDLTALAKELRAVEEVRPLNKVTDYSSSSEESGTTDEEDEDVEQEGADESTSGPEDSRAVYVDSALKPPGFLTCHICDVFLT